MKTDSRPTSERTADPLSRGAILTRLGKPEGIRLVVTEETGSTNLTVRNAAENGEPEGLVLIADRQTAGRGRAGRRFFSPGGTGLYMSFLFRPEKEASSSLTVTTAAAVAVADAIETVSGREPEIKWVNDVLLDGKKVCGILTEGTIRPGTDRLSYAVLGIGINVTEPDGGFPPEIREIAGAVCRETVPGFRNRLAAAVIENVLSCCRNAPGEDIFERYRRRLALIGRPVTVMKPGACGRPATAMALDRAYRLLVGYGDGTEEWLDSGEVRLIRTPVSEKNTKNSQNNERNPLVNG